MIMLQNLIQTQLANALGWALIHSLWQGAVIAMALAVALRVVRSSSLRYVFACLAMLAILMGFVLTFARLMPGSDAAGGFARSLSRSYGGRLPDLVSFRSHAGPVNAPQWLVPFWMVGVVLLHLRNLAGWAAAMRLRRRGICYAPEIWQRRLTHLRETIRLSKPVALMESCMASVPAVIGHFRPVILVPAGLLTGMPAIQIEAILLHELAHIRRRDYLVNLLQLAAESLLFYHPSVWWISGEIRAERENCCDDLAVTRGGNAREYAEALVDLEENRWSANRVAVAANGGSLMKRVRRLLFPGEKAGFGPMPLVPVAILTLIAAFTLAAWQAKPVDNSPQARADAHRAWVNEDVAYIIEDREREAFNGLRTDEERDMFVTQFWLRRDPTPGTAVNEFKEEHYRRIAYVNEHYGTLGYTPGWKTDRGRIYIVYGPPDELESHPHGGPSAAFPFEQWLYRHIEGVGDRVVIEFVDKARNGDYPMTRDPHAK